MQGDWGSVSCTRTLGAGDRTVTSVIIGRPTLTAELQAEYCIFM